MDELRISLPYLEGLTTAELYALAGRFELDLPPGLGRSAIMEELVDIAPCLVFYQSALTEAPPPASPEDKTQLALPDPATLPKQYNMTYIDVLVRDPFWVFVIWEISAHDRKKYEKAAGFQGYTLRVRRAAAVTKIDADFLQTVRRLRGFPFRRTMEMDADFLYTVRFTEHFASRYLNFPSDGSREGGGEEAYIVELCAVCRDAMPILVSSRPFCLPKSMPCFSGAPSAHSPALLLSGIEKLAAPRGAR
jgi:hypothetical protein